MTMELNEKIYFKENIPYYNGLPCFLSGYRMDSEPWLDHGMLRSYYLRDAGLYECRVIEVTPGAYSCTYVNYNGEKWYGEPMTFDEWKRSNGIIGNESIEDILKYNADSELCKVKDLMHNNNPENYTEK